VAHRASHFERRYLLASAVLALAALLWCGVVSAYTGTQVEMTCPYDGTKFSFEAQMSGTAFGMTLDFMTVGPIRSPSPLAVCPTNGFVFFKTKFSDEELDRLRPLILSSEYQALKEETAYYRGAWMAERMGLSHRDVSMMLLQATWEVFDVPARYERYAAELAGRLPEDIGGADTEQKWPFQCLLGELMRRRGRFDEARRYFSSFSTELKPNSDEALIVAFEIELIDKRDAELHLIAEAIKGQEAKQDVWQKRRTPSLSNSKLLKQTNLFKFVDGRQFHWIGNDLLHGTTKSGAMSFDVASGTAASIDIPIVWGYPHAYSWDGKIVVTQGPGPSGEERLFQRDSRSFAVLHSVPLRRGWTQNIAMAYDKKSALVELDNALAAFALGSDTLEQLSSPVFPHGRDDWWLRAADPTGPRIAVLHEDTIAIWDYKRHALIRELRPGGWTKSMTADLDVVFSRDGKKIFIGADAYWDAECEFTVWDASKGKQLSRMRVKGAPGAKLVISPDEKLAAMECGKYLYFWDSRFAGPPAETAEASSHFGMLAFGPNSRELAVELGDALLVYSIAP
jgi:hypothetical protein